MTQYSSEWPGQQGPEGVAYFVPSDSIVAGPRDKGLAASALTHDVRSIDDGDFLLFNTPYAVIAEDNGTVAHFNEVPELGLSRQRSAQEVVFGQLIVSSQTEREAADLVAIKPYNLLRGAVQEAGALHVVNGLVPGRTRPLSFEPLGFYRTPDGNQTGLITRYDASVISQDNLFWDPERDPTELEASRAFHHAAVALGALHSHSLAHKDAQVKNIARQNRGVRIVDLTDLRRMKDEGAAADVVDDIGKYASSLNHVDDADGRGGGNFARDYTDLFVDTFIPRYVSAINDKTSLLPHSARLSPENIEAIARDAASFDPYA
ncbi:MAG: hypothetical protein ABWX94_00725 [Candidatus Saccharimonadales bacterium]